MDVEFVQHLILALMDARERLDGVGTCEIRACINRLRKILPENKVLE